MFTGIVQQVGTIRRTSPKPYGTQFVVEAGYGTDLVHGESIAVNGVCLTVETFDDRGFEAYASEETLAKSNLGKLSVGDPVNLERALLLTDRLGGHLMQGHVDGVGSLVRREKRGPGTIFHFEVPEDLARYVIPKGSIGLDGISLTVNTVDGQKLSIYAIPTTLAETTLPEKQPGSPINVEVDVIAKYVERFLLLREGTAPGKSLAEILSGWGR